MTKIQMPLDVAVPIAEHVRRVLLDQADAFSRVEIAGSIRRRKAVVGDLELVAEIDPDREFGATDRIKAALGQARVERAPPTRRADGATVRAPWGERYLKGVYARDTPLAAQVDLFVVRPPAEWGVVYLIRTGSARFSEAMVTRLHRYDLRSEGGRIVHSGRDGTHGFVECATEERFFDLAHVPLVDPPLRDMDLPETALLFAGGM